MNIKHTLVTSCCCALVSLATVTFACDGGSCQSSGSDWCSQCDSRTTGSCAGSCIDGWVPAYSDLCGNRYQVFRNIGATDDSDVCSDLSCD